MTTRTPQDCYVISLKHTHREELYITVWRPNDKGYCWALSRAGKYDRENVLAHLDYYNSGCSNVAVPCEILDGIAIPPKPGHHDNDTGPVVPNTRASWKLILANLIAEPKYKSNPQFKGAPKQKEWA